MSDLPPDRVLAEPPARLRADVAVIGSGPGGAVTACTLAEAGRDVLLIEEGALLPLESCAPFTIQEMVQKYRNAGVTAALGPTKVAYVEGRCVGGGSEINSGLYHRTPPDVLEQWAREFRVEALGEDDLLPHFAACEKDLCVSPLPGPAPPASRKLHEGAGRLGWKSLEVPRWSRQGERQTMTRTFVPRAVYAGARLLADTAVRKLRRREGRWVLQCEHRSRGRAVEVEAPTAFVSGGAIQTPALLRRSGITRNVGNSLRMHPTVKVVARFAEEVNPPGVGVPVHQVKEFAPRFSFGGSISAPHFLALAMLDHPEHLHEVDAGWRNMAVYYAMIPGSGPGSVRGLPGFRDPLVRYRITPADLAELADGLEKLCRLLFAAGAIALYPSVAGGPCLGGEADLGRLPKPLPARRTNLMTIHLFSSCPMGEDRKRCAADSFGRAHGVPGLHLADASLLCSPPGVNPQGSIMAVARRNAFHFLEAGA